MAQVSCLMVTRGDAARMPMVARAIADYAAQTHAERELVIVTDHSVNGALAALIAQTGRDDIRLVATEETLTLGALRNLSIAAARGEFVCQWDDDDLHHPRRIESQLAALKEVKSDAVLLTDVLLLDTAASELRWTNWAATPGGVHPGTLLCRRAAALAYPEEGPAASLGEDLAALLALEERASVFRLAGAPHLYVYVAHGANSWPSAHHVMLSATLSISSGLLRRRERALREGLAPLAILPGTRVTGPNGLGFVL
jgi:glycosyltransferase involved in cell wall biosynthesis